MMTLDRFDVLREEFNRIMEPALRGTRRAKSPEEKRKIAAAVNEVIRLKRQHRDSLAREIREGSEILSKRIMDAYPSISPQTAEHWSGTLLRYHDINSCMHGLDCTLLQNEPPSCGLLAQAAHRAREKELHPLLYDAPMHALGHSGDQQ